MNEQNFYRDEQNRLMCSGCNAEVFGGTCTCTWQHKGESVQTPHITVVDETTYQLLAEEESKRLNS